VRLAPLTYIHVKDTNRNVTRVVNGPATFTVQEHEKVISSGVQHMIVIRPYHFLIVENPPKRDAAGVPEIDKYGQVKIRRGDEEIRLYSDFPKPFPLYPGEKLKGTVTPLRVVPQQAALLLKATRNVGEHAAGDEWLFHGPGVHLPKVGIEIVEEVSATVVTSGTALRIQAKRSCKDHKGNVRKAGEEWLVRRLGSYIPSVNEKLLKIVKEVVLTAHTALHIRATRTFKDVYGIERKAGEEWLVTSDMTETHIPDVYEDCVGRVDRTTMTDRQYCVILDPVVDGKQRLGSKQLRKGPVTFFLQPGESLEDDIQDVYVLGEFDALLIRATEEFTDAAKGVQRMPGDIWMVYGPCEFIPPVQVLVVEQRHSIPLNSTDGIYVRDTQTGKVRSVIGATTYMLKPREVLWEKDVAPEVETLLTSQNSHKRDRTQIIKYAVGHGTLVQVYDYKSKESRYVFGPNLVMLGPDEQFTVMHLSGSKPKKPYVVTTIDVRLGPDFMTDIIIVETSDHARLKLTLCYSWLFDITKETAYKVFAVKDFVGDACKAIASRVRNAVASKPFDEFHKHSSRIIRRAVFGVNKETDSTRTQFRFASNELIINGVDVQAVEPVDSRTRESLQKSVTQAIEITTRATEARAKHAAFQEEEESKGELDQQRLVNSAKAEEFRKQLLAHEAENMEIESKGQATADAKARAKASEIEAEASVSMAKARAKVTEISSVSALKQLEKEREAEVAHKKALDTLEIDRKSALAKIEAGKFAKTMDAIGADTIASIARAGPEMQAELLKGLGLQGFLVTDGTNPVNLFQTASSMITPGGVTKS